MKKLLIIAIFTSCANALIAQGLGISAGYSYLHSQQMNKTFDVYNFSRPWLVNEQPNFSSGLYGHAFYRLGKTGPIASGISARYQFFRSSAENPGFKLQLNFHTLDLAYQLHLEQPTRGNRPYADLEIGAVGGLMTRLINDENVQSDEEDIDALGIGGNIRLSVGYQIRLNNAWAICPNFSMSYTPYFYMPDAEAMINQTINLTSSDNQPMLMGQFGITFHQLKNTRRR